MEDLTFNTKRQVAATTSIVDKSGVRINPNGTSSGFSSFLVFSSKNMPLSMSMQTASIKEPDMRERIGEKDINKNYDDTIRSSENYHHKDDYSKDHVERSQGSPKGDYENDQSYNGHQQSAEQATDLNNGANDRGHSDNDQASKNTSNETQETSTNKDNNENQTTQSGEQAGEQTTASNNVSEQAASNAFTQEATATLQTAVDPAIVAMADPKKGSVTQATVQQNTQQVQNVDVDAGSNKELFSNGWQSGSSKNNADAQGQSQMQNGIQNKTAQANQQAIDPQLQAQATGEAQRQAAALSKKIGPDQRANVNVSVTNQSSDMTSQQSQNLSNAAQVATEGNNPLAQTKAQGNAQSAAVNQGQNAQAAVVNAQGPQQQNNNTQNNQNQTFQNMVGDVKGTSSTAKTATVQQPQGMNGEAAQTNTQNTAQQTQQSQQAAQTRQAAQHKPTVHTSAKPEDIHVEISKAAKAGHDRINIHLKPAELGRIEVQMDMSSGKVVTNIVAERPETLQMLKQDASSLNKALEDAGLKMGDMNFNLQKENDQGQQAAGSSNGGNGSLPGQNSGPEEEMLLASQMDTLAQQAQERAAARGGVDISA